RILSFYTSDYGKLKGIAKGARRSRKRFVGNLEPPSHIRLIFFQGLGELVRVEDAGLIDGFNGLKNDIEKFSPACYLLELVSEMTREGQSQSTVFGLLTGFLKMLEEGGRDEAVMRFFEIRLLTLLGYLPYLEGCVVCRTRFVNAASGSASRPPRGEAAGRGRGLYFSSEKGGAVCRRCSYGSDGLLPVMHGTARFLSTAARLDAGQLGRLKPDEAFLREAEAILNDFIRHQIGKELKTRRFLYKMRNASV
ncbi:MAG: DNA repair protein RecO, partial [Deltaproteobacteria bacterium]|nr:DNA repair protein RecO [Deltaproteobacteria bacterium]